MKARLLVCAVIASTASGCLDALFEASDVIEGQWVPCCSEPDRTLDTRLAVSGEVVLSTSFSSCGCSGASCARYAPGPARSCKLLGAFTDAGVAFDGGATVGLDAGVSGPDAGAPFDGGSGSGGSDAGVAAPETYELCCTSGALDSCLCRDSQCSNTPLTFCPNNRCAPEGQSCVQ